MANQDSFFGYYLMHNHLDLLLASALPERVFPLLAVESSNHVAYTPCLNPVAMDEAFPLKIELPQSTVQDGSRVTICVSLCGKKTPNA